MVALLLASVAEDTEFARAGTHRVDISPFALPMYLALGLLAGWTLVVLVAHFAGAVPLDTEQAQGE